ncbi:MAG: hypothetical protein WBW48_05845 [Anaerolineae bacterium]
MIKRSLRAFCNFTRHPVIGMVVVAAFAFFVYRDALGFLFFNDDPTGHFRWMEGRSIVSFFVSAWGHAYYRPLSFVLWEALHAVLDHHDPFLLHSLNIVFHAANCSLVWLLAYRLTKHRGYAFMAAVLFTLYPFSYEEVAYVGAFVHPLTTFFVLATLVLYRAAKQGASWLFYASHLTLVLALFTQESAVVAPLLLIAWELIGRGSSYPPLRRPGRLHRLQTVAPGVRPGVWSCGSFSLAGPPMATRSSWRACGRFWPKDRSIFSISPPGSSSTSRPTGSSPPREPGRRQLPSGKGSPWRSIWWRRTMAS